MSAKLRLQGIYPAFPTATDSEARVNADAMRRLVDHLVGGGASGLVPVGGTGEYTALSPRERVRAVETTVAAARGRVPVIPGILSPGFAEAVEAGAAFKAAGADALMLVAPFYVTPSQAGIRDYFRAYRDKIDLPILLYDISSRTRISVDPDTIAGMVEDGTIIGMKACNTDANHFNRVINFVGDRIGVLSGEDLYFPIQVAMGGAGGVLASATLIPRYWVDMFEAARKDLSEALRRQRALFPLLDAIFAECNPGPLKEAMRMVGHDLGRALLPLTPPSAATIAKLEKAIAELRAAKVIPSGAVAA
jgi:4-hydroxy-tetrahydrodipicolinate synthase